MPDNKNNRFDNLDLAGRAIAGVSMRPTIVIYATGLALLLLAWATVIAMGALAAKTALGENAGPGASLLRMLPDFQLPSMFSAFFALCFGAVEYQATGFSVAIALWAMWILMAIAMMMPSAAPMIRTYCEIAETARGKAMRAAHPLFLLAGYLTVWALVAAIFAATTLVLKMTGATGAYAYPVQGIFTPAALALAGIYQFTNLKQACLTKCRNPFSTLFGKWSDRPARVFRLGMEEGLFCAGCCWALMLVMFAVGMMNVFWMALLTMVAIVEKSKHAQWLTPASGVILLVWAAALMFIQV